MFNNGSTMVHQWFNNGSTMVQQWFNNNGSTTMVQQQWSTTIHNNPHNNPKTLHTFGSNTHHYSAVAMAFHHPLHTGFDKIIFVHRQQPCCLFKIPTAIGFGRGCTVTRGGIAVFHLVKTHVAQIQHRGHYPKDFQLIRFGQPNHFHGVFHRFKIIFVRGRTSSHVGILNGVGIAVTDETVRTGGLQSQFFLLSTAGPLDQLVKEMVRPFPLQL